MSMFYTGSERFKHVFLCTIIALRSLCFYRRLESPENVVTYRFKKAVSFFIEWTVKVKILKKFNQWLNDLGHVLRMREIPLSAGKDWETLQAESRKTFWLRNLEDWFGESLLVLFRSVASGVSIAMMIASLRRGDGTWRRNDVLNSSQLPGGPD